MTAHAPAITSPRAGLPPTSLIICSRNRPQLLLESIESVLLGDAVPSELLIVDQSDVEHTHLASLQTQRPCTIRYLWTHSVGLSRASNIGVAHATHDLIAFTHDDVCVQPAWFEALIRALLVAGPRAVITGQVLPTGEENPGGFQLTIKVDDVPAIYEGRIGMDVLYPLNMAMYRSSIAAVGGFDERLGPGTPFPAAEDGDFAYRLLEAGYRIIYDPRAALYHRAWRPGGDYLSLRWSYGRGLGAFYAKYLSLCDRYMLRRMAADLGRHAARLVFGCLRRSRRQSAADVVHILGLSYGAARWLLTQRETR